MNIIKQLLAKNNMTITDLAKKLNIDRSTLSRYINNSEDLIKANYTIVYAICCELNIISILLSEKQLKKEISAIENVSVEELKFVGEEIRKDFLKRENTHIEGTYVDRLVDLEIKVFFQGNEDYCQYVISYTKYKDGEMKVLVYMI